MSDNDKNAIIAFLIVCIVIMAAIIGGLAGTLDGSRALVKEKQDQNERLQMQLSHDDVRFSACMTQLRGKTP